VFGIDSTKEAILFGILAFPIWLPFIICFHFPIYRTMANHGSWYSVKTLYFWGWGDYQPFSTPGDGWTYTVRWGWCYNDTDALDKCEQVVAELRSKWYNRLWWKPSPKSTRNDT